MGTWIALPEQRATKSGRHVQNQLAAGRLLRHRACLRRAGRKHRPRIPRKRERASDGVLDKRSRNKEPRLEARDRDVTMRTLAAAVVMVLLSIVGGAQTPPPPSLPPGFGQPPRD